ncbi:MAG: filamentous hemagglutinin N-terminal domain-containing protein, partial [Candidatus Accumulibacter sp.]|nr:filamentous hemagglutinin N-terminal domain-containing protein [Accumulibacter sp.]
MILQTGNGVPLVNIQTPSAAGVSRNHYSQFDVQQNGVILNNARTAAQTQLGGWIQANPQLASGSARVILNEVLASAPSQLRGYIEVGGTRAEVIVANPAGIVCDGCGFINAARNTLTTGTPLLNQSNGALEGYRVEGGTITLQGQGLDARQSEATDLLARTIKVTAPLHANALNLIAGRNRIDGGQIDTAQITPLDPAGASTPPTEYAIDVAYLGGMYANKIHLIATEAGVGVRNAGELGAQAGDIRLTAEGRIENAGHIVATNDLQIEAPRIDNQETGELAAAHTARIQTERLANQGLIDGEATQIQAQTLANTASGRIYGDRVAIEAEHLANQGDPEQNTAPVIAARETLELGVKTLTNADGALILSLGDLAIGGALDATQRASGRADAIDNTSAVIEAQSALTIDTASLTNRKTAFEIAHGLPDTAQMSAREILDYAPELQFRWTIKETSPSNWRDFVRDRYIGIIDDLLAGGGQSLDAAERAELEALITGQPRSVYEDTRNVWNLLLDRIEAQHPEHIAVMAQTLTDRGVPSTAYAQTCRDKECDYIHYLSTTKSAVRDEITVDTPAAVLSAGGNVVIAADTLSNAYSTIQSGGDMSLTGTTLTNTGAELYRTTTTSTANRVVHWVRRGHGTTISASSTQTLIASAPAILSAGGTLTGDFADRIDNRTIRQNAAPVVEPSDTAARLPGHLLAGQGLTRINLTPDGPLIETDPRFANYRTWLGSDYLLQQMQLDPGTTQKRLGDGLYEQRLITEQIAQLTGRRFLESYADDESQYRALMDAGIDYAKEWQLIPGVALSPEQIAALTTDLVWLVEREITLPDGTTHTVLVPQVYLHAQANNTANGTANNTPQGAWISGEHIQLTAGGQITTSGAITAQKTLALAAEDLTNTRGRVSGEDLLLQAGNDLTVEGGTFEAKNSLIATAGGDIRIQSSTVDQSFRPEESRRANGAVEKTVIDRVASLAVTGAGGTLVVAAGKDLTINAAVVVNAAQNPSEAGIGEANTSATTLLSAGNNLTLGTLTERSAAATRTKGNRWNETTATEVGSSVFANGELTLVSGNDLTARAANIGTDGALTLVAGNDLTLTAGEALTATERWHKSTKSGLLSKRTRESLDTREERTAISTLLSGDTVALSAGRDLAITGSQVSAAHELIGTAGRDLTIDTAQ